MSENIDLYNKMLTLGQMFENFDNAIDETENIDKVIETGSVFHNPNSITGDMIEAFMMDKVEHINAVNNLAEEKEQKILQEKNERRGTFAEKLRGDREASSLTKENAELKQEIGTIRDEMSEIKEMMKQMLASKQTNGMF